MKEMLDTLKDLVSTVGSAAEEFFEMLRINLGAAVIAIAFAAFLVFVAAILVASFRSRGTPAASNSRWLTIRQSLRYLVLLIVAGILVAIFGEPPTTKFWLKVGPNVYPRAIGLTTYVGSRLDNNKVNILYLDSGPKAVELAIQDLEFEIPAWRVPNDIIATHFGDDGRGAYVALPSFKAYPDCYVFPPGITEDTLKLLGKTKEQVCKASKPLTVKAISLIAAWAQPGQPSLEEIKRKLASSNASERAEGRVALQKSKDVASEFGQIIEELYANHTSVENLQVLVQALIAAIYFGDDTWQSISTPTKTKLVGLLVDPNETVAHYARSVIRRYPEQSALEQIKAAQSTANPIEQMKLLVAISDIEYNLGVRYLVTARADATDPTKWKHATDAFKRGMTAVDSVGTVPPRDRSDVQKNLFGLALTTADNWSYGNKPKEITPATIKDGFQKFLSEVDQREYSYAEQIDSARCARDISADDNFASNLQKCLKFFR
jgi:hypothetical protein